MLTTRTLLVTAATAGLAALAPAVASAAVTPGARYDGAGGKPAIRQHVTVAKSGTKLSAYELAASGRCSDGKRFGANTELGTPRTVPVDATGAFAHTFTEKRAVLIHGKKNYDGSLQTTITGSSSPDATAITVTITGLFQAKGLRCTSAATVVLHRDGSPAAPFSDARMTTGSYPGITKGSFRVSSFKALAPGGELRRFEVSGRARCTVGRDVPAGATFPVLGLTPRDTFDVVAATKTKSKRRPGYRALFADHLKLRFFRRGASYGYSGSYSATIIFRRAGKPTDRCKVPLTRFETLIPSAKPPAR